MQLTEQDLIEAGITNHFNEVLSHVKKTIKGVGFPDDIKLEMVLAKMYYERQWPGVTRP